MILMFQFLVVSLVVLLGTTVFSANQPKQGENKAETVQVLDLKDYHGDKLDQEHIRETSGKTRNKRSIGLLAALMERVMQAEAIEEEIESEDEDSVEKVVKCSIVLDRRSCTISETESRCTNHYERKCFLYTYPVLDTVPQNNLPQK